MQDSRVFFAINKSDITDSHDRRSATTAGRMSRNVLKCLLSERSADYQTNLNRGLGVGNIAFLIASVISLVGCHRNWLLIFLVKK